MATLTINMSAAVATRISKALQESRGMPEPATPEEVKEYAILKLKQLVKASELRIATAAASAPNLNLT